LLLAIVGGVLLMYRGGRTQPPKPAAAIQAVSVAPTEVRLPGKVQPVKVVQVPAPVDGVIQRLMVDVGDTVFEGELLAHIQDPKLEAARNTAAMELEQARKNVSELEAALIATRLQASRSNAESIRAKGDLDRAEKEHVRQQMLNKEGATPRLVFEKAQNEYSSLEAESASLVATARKDEERLSSLAKELPAAQAVLEQKSSALEEAVAELAAGDVRSPVDGMVMAVQGHAGSEVHKDALELFELAADLGSLQVVLAPDAGILPRIRSGQAAVIEIAAVAGKIPGTVREVKRGEVRVDFASPSPQVRPGQIAQVVLILSAGGGA